MHSISLQNLTQNPTFFNSQVRSQLLELSIFTIILLNTFDATMTILWVTTGLAVEANPLMAPLLDTHPVFFFLAKIALVYLGCALLWKHRETRSAVVGIILLNAIYYALTLYHVTAIGHIISWFV